MDSKKVNNELKRVVGVGNYISKPLYKQDEITNEFDYCHFITTADQIFTLVTKNGWFQCHVNEVEWKIFWDALGDIPTDENECIEQPFEHFEIGTDTEDIWHWFEWYFDISLGKAIDNELTKKQTSAILSYVSNVFGFSLSGIYNFHNNKHDQYGILMCMIDQIESLALEWNGVETSYNIFIKYDFTAVKFDLSLGLEDNPTTIKSHGTDGNKIEAILKTLYKLAHWHYNVYLERKIIGYQIHIDNNLDHCIHATFEVIEKDSISLNDYLNTAITRYPESVISLQPIKQSEIEHPSFI